MSAERAKLTVKQLRQVRKALRRQNDAKFGYDQFGMRVTPKRLASHSRPTTDIVVGRQAFAESHPHGPCSAKHFVPISLKGR